MQSEDEASYDEADAAPAPRARTARGAAARKNYVIELSDSEEEADGESDGSDFGEESD